MGYRHSRERKDGSAWLAYRCGGHHRTNGSMCRSYYVPAEGFEDAVLQGVADRLASKLGRSEVRTHIGQVVGRLRKDADKRLRVLDAAATERETQIARVIDLGIDGGLDREACNDRIRSLRAEAADIRDKGGAFEVVLRRMDGIEDEVQALLASADRLVRNWLLLEPCERRARLHDLVTTIVVSPHTEQGGTNTAEIHFRGLLEDSGTTRLRVRKDIARRAENPQEIGLRAGSGPEAYVSQTNGSPPRIRTRNPLVNSQSLYR